MPRLRASPNALIPYIRPKLIALAARRSLAVTSSSLRLNTSAAVARWMSAPDANRSEEHTSELQSLMRISYAVFCLKKKKKNIRNNTNEKKYKNNNKKRQK